MIERVPEEGPTQRFELMGSGHRGQEVSACRTLTIDSLKVKPCRVHKTYFTRHHSKGTYHRETETARFDGFHYPEAPGAFNGRPRPSVGHPRKGLGVPKSQNLALNPSGEVWVRQIQLKQPNTFQRRFAFSSAPGAAKWRHRHEDTRSMTISK